MKIGVLVDNLGLPLREGILAAANEGVSGVQLYVDLGWSPSERKELAAFIKENGLVLSAMCGDLDIGGFADPQKNPRFIDIVKHAFDVALEMGCHIVTRHIGVVPDDKNHPRYGVIQEACETAGRYAESMGGIFAIETGPEKAEVLERFIGSLSTKGVGVNLDPANLVMTFGGEGAPSVYTLKDYIVHTHIKDGRLKQFCDPDIMYGMPGAPEIEGDEWDYCEETPVGEGDVNFPSYLSALKAIGYTGFLTVEREMVENPVEDMKRSVAYVKALIADK